MKARLIKAVERASYSFSVARRFAPDARLQRVQLSLALSGSILAALIELLRPWPLKWIVDGALAPKGVPHHGPGWFIWTGALAYLVVTLAKGGIDYFATLRTAQAQKQLTRSLRYRLFDHLLRLSPAFHARHKTGDMIVRMMGDVSMVTTMLTESLVELTSRTLLIVGTLAMMFWVDPVLTALVLGIGPLFLVIVALLSRSITIQVRKARAKEGELADTMYEAVMAVPLIQSLGRVEHTVHRFARSSRSSVRADFKTAKLSARMGLSVELLLGCAVAVGLLYGSQRVLDGRLTAGDLIVFVAYVRGLVKPVRQTGRSTGRFAKGAACGERILSVLAAPVEVRTVEHPRQAPERPARLTFEDVHYAYPVENGVRPALEGFSAEFRPGQLIGVCGQSGAGKSTLTCLALRLFDPSRGRVLLDGQDLRELELQSLRGRFALCMQETFLFGDTVRENLLFGLPEAADAALWRALDEANAADFVRALPLGLDTPLGSAGSGLSGGQRRRLQLARTLLRRAPILILDEPFSGLDRESIVSVREALLRLARDSIVLVISHEHDQLELCDRVVFLDGGRLAAHGTHRELLRSDPRYRAVLELAQES